MALLKHLLMLVTEIYENKVPIGYPVWNTTLYILDKNFNPVPSGVAGELFISGMSLAHGYLNKPELSSEKFIPDPYSASKGCRMYRTGDKVRLLKNGAIDFIERIDNQGRV